MDIESFSKDKEFDAVIVGAGASGLGVGIVLKKLGINYVILEKDSVGSSFRKWPKETRFISPLIVCLALRRLITLPAP